MSARKDNEVHLSHFERIDLSDGIERTFAPLEHPALLTVGASETIAIEPEKTPLVRGLQKYVLGRVSSLEQYMEGAPADNSLELEANQLARIGRTNSPQLELNPAVVAPLHAVLKATQSSFSAQVKKPSTDTRLYIDPADRERPFPAYSPVETISGNEREWLRSRLLELVPAGSVYAFFNDDGVRVGMRVVDDPEHTTKVIKLSIENLEDFPELRRPKKVKARTISIGPNGTELQDTPANKVMHRAEDKAIIPYLPPTPLLRKQFTELSFLVEVLASTWRES